MHLDSLRPWLVYPSFLDRDIHSKLGHQSYDHGLSASGQTFLKYGLAGTHWTYPTFVEM